MGIKDRIKHAWNAFLRDDHYRKDNGPSSSIPNHKTISVVNKSIAATIFNRIAIDVSMTKFKHVKVNPENEDETVLKTGLNECLTVEANIDQNSVQFLHDIVYSMFDEGVVAVVPVDTTINPELSGSYDINSLRVGKVVNWFPQKVEVLLYNERSGQNERIILEKRNVAIIENPLYAIVNGSNSTLKRLIRKLGQMDNLDDNMDTGRLDLLISLPYAIKTTAQQKMADDRIKSIEKQLASGRNGIAYIDATEKAMQLNRPVNDQLKESVRELKVELYNQLGLTENIFNGTASESELRTYYTRTIDPILESITSEFIRKFITKTGRTQGQTILYYRDMFKMVSVEHIAALSDTLRRNSIASANEIRRLIGLKASNDPRADELFNPNMADDKQDGNVKFRKPEVEDEKPVVSHSPDSEEV